VKRKVIENMPKQKFLCADGDDDDDDGGVK